MSDDLFSILRDYPQIYLACHSSHRARKGKKAAITTRDATFLAHIADGAFAEPATLARHLALARSTVSEELKRLRALGLVAMDAADSDGRRKRIELTDAGRQAIVGASVLDAARVRLLLEHLTARDRRAAVKGLRLLAEGARALADGAKTDKQRGGTR
jgi:DNA-binding MarR family transcriptional regulator